MNNRCRMCVAPKAHADKRDHSASNPIPGQVPKNSSKSPLKQSCDVFHDDVARSKLANDSEVLTPESRSLAVDSGSVPSEADVLTRETSADDIHWLQSFDSANVEIARHVRIVLLENQPAERVDLHLPANLKSRSLKPQIEPADAGEQRTYREGQFLSQPLDALSGQQLIDPFLIICGTVLRTERRPEGRERTTFTKDAHRRSVMLTEGAESGLTFAYMLEAHFSRSKASHRVRDASITATSLESSPLPACP